MTAQTMRRLARIPMIVLRSLLALAIISLFSAIILLRLLFKLPTIVWNATGTAGPDGADATGANRHERP